MSHRDALLSATEQLLWKVGYESMSPKLILRTSGAGQGSMYHHFTGKKDLAIQAMQRHEEYLWAHTQTVLEQPTDTPLLAIKAWLTLSRDAFAGCRLGRLANEESVHRDDELRAPLQRFFSQLHQRVTRLLGQAQSTGHLRDDIDPDHLACTLIAVIQGGYVLAKATHNPTHFAHATSAAWQLLQPSK